MRLSEHLPWRSLKPRDSWDWTGDQLHALLERNPVMAACWALSVLACIDYKPGWEFDLNERSEPVPFWDLLVCGEATDSISWRRMCRDVRAAGESPKPAREENALAFYDRPALKERPPTIRIVSRHPVDPYLLARSGRAPADVLVEHALCAVTQMETHERDEFFAVRGKLLHDPHTES